MSLVSVDALDGLPNIRAAREFSNEKLKEMRGLLEQQGGLGDSVLGTYGSYARREASPQSDLDFFVICRTPQQIEATKRSIEPLTTQLISIAGREPTKNGAF
jgi:predicted nucleotidyltransferase